jgi:hypothetical protein
LAQRCSDLNAPEISRIYCNCKKDLVQWQKDKEEEILQGRGEESRSSHEEAQGRHTQERKIPARRLKARSKRSRSGFSEARQKGAKVPKKRSKK